MSSPLRYIRLTGTWTKGATPAPATGWVRVIPLDEGFSPAADLMVGGQPLDVRLVGGALVYPVDGLPGVPVLDPGDPDLAHPVYLELQVLLDDTPPQALLLDVSTSGSTIDVADAVQLAVPDPDSRHSEMVPWSAVGAAGGVAPLGPDKKVPLDFLPPAVGGTPAFVHTQNTPQSVVDVTHGLGFKPSVSAFSLDMGDQYDEFKVQHLSDSALRVTMDAPTACVLVMS